MSHIETRATACTKLEIIKKACERLKLRAPVEGTFKLFSSSARGIGVHLPDWKYPVVFDLQTGKAEYDNYNGSWGNGAKLDEFMQGYAVEAARSAAEEQGYSILEEKFLQESGEIRLVLDVAGGAGGGQGWT